jgi:HlyD family secretion protein
MHRALIVTLIAGCHEGTAPIEKTGPAVRPSPKRVETLALAGNAAIEATGTALPIREALLSAAVPGRITDIPVKLGQKVKKGETLLRLDPYGFSLGVAQAEAALAAAKVQADQATRELERMERLVSAKVAPGASYDQIKASHDAAQAQQKVAEAALKQAQKALADSSLRAPFDCTVDAILKEVGEYAPSMPPTMLLKIVDVSSLVIQLYLPESRAKDVKEGMSATVELESAGITTQGRVVFVSNRIQPGTQTFEVRIEIANQGQKIKGGAFARVTLAEPQERAGFILPTRVIQKSEDGAAYVFVVENGTARKVAVTLGESKGEGTLITGGLDRQHLIITSDFADLSDGDPVSPQLN